MIDPALVGTSFPAVSYSVDRAKIRELAAAIGDPNPLYYDLAAARAAGFPDLPAPPTLPTLFAFWPSPSVLDLLAQLGIELRQILHGEEEYVYGAPVYAGDTISGFTKLVSARARRTMEFITLETVYTNQRGQHAATAKTLMIARHDL